MSSKPDAGAPSVFDTEEQGATGDGTIILNKSRFVEYLLKLKIQDSTGPLRTQVRRLKGMLRDTDSDSAGLLNIAENGDTVTISRAHLMAHLNQIEESLTLERAAYYADRLLKGVTETRTNNINDINLNRWKEYDDIITNSLWLFEKRDSSGVHTAGYWGNYIPQIPNQLIRRYTRRREWVLDTFVGSGTTLIESQRLGRNGIGIELQPTISEAARNLVETERNPYNIVSDVITGDSATIDFGSTLRRHGIESVQLLLMHPPYHDIIKFSDDPRDLSNAPSVGSFLEKMKSVVGNASQVLDTGRYLAVVIGDKYSKGEWIPLGFLTMNEITKQGFMLKSVIVKNFEDTTAKRNQKELWRYRALVGGFYVFKHEYIFVFRKSSGGDSHHCNVSLV